MVGSVKKGLGRQQLFEKQCSDNDFSCVFYNLELNIVREAAKKVNFLVDSPLGGGKEGVRGC